jgi:hypothetical protein
MGTTSSRERDNSILNSEVVNDSNSPRLLCEVSQLVLHCLTSYFTVADATSMHRLSCAWNKRMSDRQLWKTLYFYSCPYWSPNDHEVGIMVGFKRLYQYQMELGWSLSTRPDSCGSHIEVCGPDSKFPAFSSRDIKKFRSARLLAPSALPRGVLTYEAISLEALTQVILTERGMYRGVHSFTVRLDTVGWGSSVGLCKAYSAPNPQHAFLQLYQDGGIGLLKGMTLDPAHARVRRNLQNGDVVNVLLDLDKKKCEFRVNGELWLVILNVSHDSAQPRLADELLESWIEGTRSQVQAFVERKYLPHVSIKDATNATDAKETEGLVIANEAPKTELERSCSTRDCPKPALDRQLSAEEQQQANKITLEILETLNFYRPQDATSSGHDAADGKVGTVNTGKTDLASMEDTFRRRPFFFALQFKATK